MAMMRNKDIRMAVAMKPNDIAFTDAPRPVQGTWASLSIDVLDGLGSELVSKFQVFSLPGSKPPILTGLSLLRANLEI